MNMKKVFLAVGLWKTLLVLIMLIVNTSLIVRLFFGGQSFWVYTELQDRREQLLAEIDEYDEVNRLLSREIRLLQNDSKYMERVIRARLNFVRDNEVLYLFEDKQQANMY